MADYKNPKNLSLVIESDKIPDYAVSDVGNKAYNLAKLQAAGVPVPDFFSISTDAYLHFMNVYNLLGPIGCIPKIGNGYISIPWHGWDAREDV